MPQTKRSLAVASSKPHRNDDGPSPPRSQPRGTICPLPILGGLHHHYVRI